MRQSPLERSRFRGFYLVLLACAAGAFLFIALQESASMEESRTLRFVVVAFGVAAGVALVLVLAPHQRRWRKGADDDAADASNAAAWSWLAGGVIGTSALLLTIGGAPVRAAVFSFIAGLIGAAAPVLSWIYRSDAR